MDTYLWSWVLTYLICPATVFGITTRKAKHQAFDIADLSDRCIPECAIQLLEYNFIGTRVESDLQNGFACVCEGFLDEEKIVSGAILMKMKGETVFQPPEIAELDSTVVLKTPSASHRSQDINITIEVTSNQSNYGRFNIEEMLWYGLSRLSLTNFTFDLSNATVQTQVLHVNTFPVSIDLSAKQTIYISRNETIKMFIDGTKVTDDVERMYGSDFVILSVQQYNLKVLVHRLSFDIFEDSVYD